MKRRLKRFLEYKGLPETAHLRELMQARHRHSWPYCPRDEGDLLYLLARSRRLGNALEIGFATGSTALHMLSGLEGGHLTSVDYAQDEYERQGVALVHAAGMSGRHTLIEKNSAEALPRLWSSGERFDLIFMDGWKTFDHIWVDCYYCAHMLRIGGYIVFDDARMQAVRKCISILSRYYEFELVNTYDIVGGWRQRIWHLLTTRSSYPPYVTLRKVKEIRETAAGRLYNYWRPF